MSATVSSPGSCAKIRGSSASNGRTSAITTAPAITDGIDLAVIDASFISLTRVIPPVLGLIKAGALMVALIKPQFEAEKGEIGEHGVVRDPEVHRRVLADLEGFCRELGLLVLGTCESPLTGPAGNREFFICARKPLQG